MAKKRRSEREQELMTDANISRVIRLLEPEEEGVKPVSKKDACQMLGMAYNTTRLAAIIDEFKQAQARNAQRRAELRGKPATPQDVVYIITEYLKGQPIDAISKTTYRSSAFIKRILEENAVPIRVAGSTYHTPELIPDGAVRERFSIGEVVYSARYDSLAKIITEQKTEKHGWVYRIWLMSDKWLENAYQEATELASLSHLRELGVKL